MVTFHAPCHLFWHLAESFGVPWKDLVSDCLQLIVEGAAVEFFAPVFCWIGNSRAVSTSILMLVGPLVGLEAENFTEHDLMQMRTKRPRNLVLTSIYRMNWLPD